jgi:hypothetical protein
MIITDSHRWSLIFAKTPGRTHSIGLDKYSCARVTMAELISIASIDNTAILILVIFMFSNTNRLIQQSPKA